MLQRRLLALVVLSLVALGAPARAEEEPPLWTRCYDALPWHHSADVPDTEAEMQDLVARGALAEHSRTWIRAAIDRAPSIASCIEKARAEKKLLLWYVPAVEGQHMVLPHLLDRYMMTGPWAHPDVVDLVKRRFVAIRLPGGGTLAQQFGLSMPAFMQPGLLVLAPDGREIHRMDRINTFAPDHFLHLLVTLVQGEAASLGHSMSYTAAVAPLDEVREALLEGEYAAARQSLAQLGKTDPNSPLAAYLEAVLARRERDGGSALAALARASAADPDPALAVDIAVERGLVLLRMGDLQTAATALEDAVTAKAVGSRRTEAAYHLGLAYFFDGREAEALRAWRRAASREPTSPWAALADACAVEGSDGRRGESALTRSMQDVRWAAPETYRLARDTRWRRGTDDVADIRRRAVAFLLTQQRSDGSWPGFRWGAPSQGKAHHRNIEVAIGALCCSALHAWRETDPERVDRALEHGERYLLADDLVRRGEEVAWVYADAYRLSHFGRRLPELPTRRRQAVRRAMRGWVAGLVRHQEENGGCFRHYVYKSTFVTAAVTCCLTGVRQAGIRVPDEVFTRAAAVLAGARGPNGLFGYLIDRPAATRTKLGAAARQPLCLLALVRCGEAQAAELPAALDVYLESYEASTQLARKANFHIPALDHTAGYYFFHDFHAACEAARAAGTAAATQRQVLLEKLCALPEVDGAFVDCGFSYGKSYSTALALMSLHALQDGGD